MIAILGAGGAIASELLKVLGPRYLVRLVSRRPRPQAGAAETVAADLTDKDQAIAAVAGCSLVYFVAGLKYDSKLWTATWPILMANVIEASKRAGAKLIFFDNVYMYGRVNGAMTEETPFNPCSKKGEVRARIATALENEWKAGTLTAMIARCADFYGPDAPNGIANVLVFDPLYKGKKAMCLVSDSMPHSYTYTPDCARAMVQLAESGFAWNQTWHLPTAPDPPAGKAFVASAAAALGVPSKFRVLSRTMVRVGGWFNPIVGEVYEMLYQNGSLYLFDSSKFAARFGFSGTPYADGIAATAAALK